jgi:hypothetical protein
VQQCCLSTNTLGRAHTDFAQQLSVGAIFNQGLLIVGACFIRSIDSNHHNHRMCVKEHLFDLGVDRFFDLLVWDLIHEKVKVVIENESFWETKSDSHRTDSKNFEGCRGDKNGSKNSML